MNSLLEKAISGKNINDADIEDALEEICEEVHSSCNADCPVFEKNGIVPWTEDLSNCTCFKNGSYMLEFLRG